MGAENDDDDDDDDDENNDDEYDDGENHEGWDQGMGMGKKGLGEQSFETMLKGGENGVIRSHGLTENVSRE